MFSYIPDKWRLLLEEYAYFAEKKLVTSQSLLMHCEYFKKIKDQKSNLNQMAINNLKKLQNILLETNNSCSNAYKSYCYENFLYDQLTDEKKINNISLLEKK
jgi:hypothetical protein